MQDLRSDENQAHQKHTQTQVAEIGKTRLQQVATKFHYMETLLDGKVTNKTTLLCQLVNQNIQL